MALRPMHLCDTAPRAARPGKMKPSLVSLSAPSCISRNSASASADSGTSKSPCSLIFHSLSGNREDRAKAFGFLAALVMINLRQSGAPTLLQPHAGQNKEAQHARCHISDFLTPDRSQLGIERR